MQTHLKRLAPPPGARTAGGLAFRAVWFLLAAAAGQAADGRGYSLAHPAPAGELRELSPDRPDATESPFTVDGGHVQLEMDFASQARSQADGERVRTWSYAPFNLRVGVTGDFEAGLFVTPRVEERRTTDAGQEERQAGFGEMTIRAKWNFLGNDGGGTAVGAILDVMLPTAPHGLGGNRLGGALILPVAFTLPGGWEAGAMTGAEVQDDGGGYRGAWVNTVTLGHELAGDVGAYVELASTTGRGGHEAAFDIGLNWKLEPNLQLDAGANFGLTRAADDLVLFAGMTRRF